MRGETAFPTSRFSYVSIVEAVPLDRSPVLSRLNPQSRRV